MWWERKSRRSLLEAGMPEMRPSAQKDFGLDLQGFRKPWNIGKDPDAGRDWGQEEKGTTEDEMAGWYH